MAKATMARRRASAPAARPLKFQQRLVLNQWVLKLFGVNRFEELAEDLKGPHLEGLDENNVSKFHHSLKLRLFENAELPYDLLLAYDQNIVRHWKRITDRRNAIEKRTLWPKYFQYLTLLFTEVYLDRYFRDKEKLLNDLNTHVVAFNAEKPKGDQVDAFAHEDLNKLAFWNATGSGKTLLMHVNILQYRYYLEQHGRGNELNRTILLTPNEGLSNQHLEEFHLSGMQAEIFTKEGRGLFAGRSVEIIEVTKLKEKMGEKTVAVDAFEGNNLVLVDEGHRGAGGEEWMGARGKLCELGFSFEYSATFGQAMKAANKPTLTQEYAKCILVDYSYKYFYADGYGKDYSILNLSEEQSEEQRQIYLTACLLAFYQQQRLFADRKTSFAQFLIEKPLWIFVGGSVNAVRTENKRQVSDVLDVLLFLASFVKERNQSINFINRLLAGDPGLNDEKGRPIFANAFGYLGKQNIPAEKHYEAILHTLFNAETPGALHIDNIKGAGGELGIRLGENDYFGVINVGDEAKLLKLCEDQGLPTQDKDFTASLFQGLNNPESNINLLIGSRKFSEGWSSWRVSTMGLMNIGKSEGSQIIQLFGRGVRLKGHAFCLKRSTKLGDVRPPEHVRVLETLNIFGIHADYMKQFKEYLEEEGLPPNQSQTQFILPIIPNLNSKKLKTLRLKDGIDFKRGGPKPELGAPPEKLLKAKVQLDWYPRIQAMSSPTGLSSDEVAEKAEGRLTKDTHLAFMDMDEVYFELQQFKAERAWFNLNLPKQSMMELLERGDWYTLLIPPTELEFRSFDQVRQWQEIAVALLKKYADRFYKYEKSAYEQRFLELKELDENDPNFINEYRLLIDESAEDIADKLVDLKALITSKKIQDWNFKSLQAIGFGQHVYYPLLHCSSTLIEISPVDLNDGERAFVEDLRTYYEANKPFFEKRELYLLRNLSRGRGIGFFEAGNFHPDFIVWLLTPKKQFINFVDPKGLRNLEGRHDPKIAFHKTIKELETRLGDPNVTLASFIVSNTPYMQVKWWSDGMSKEDFEACNVLFQMDDRETYIGKLLQGAVRPQITAEQVDKVDDTTAAGASLTAPSEFFTELTAAATASATTIVPIPILEAVELLVAILDELAPTRVQQIAAERMFILAMNRHARELFEQGKASASTVISKPGEPFRVLWQTVLAMEYITITESGMVERTGQDIALTNADYATKAKDAVALFKKGEAMKRAWPVEVDNENYVVS